MPPKIRCAAGESVYLTQRTERGRTAVVACRRGPVPPAAAVAGAAGGARGSLTRFGYRTSQPVAARRAALQQAVTAYGKPLVRAWLLRLQQFTQNTNPALSAIYASDLRRVTSMRGG